MLTNPPRPLSRALITRPRAEAEALAAALAERGIAAIIEPMMEVSFHAVAPPDLSGVQAILCTSANGVRAFARLCPECGIPLFAVGDTTASRARREGFAEVVSAGGNASDLVRLVCERLRPAADGRLVHVAGSVIAGDLAGELRSRGFEVDRLVLYEARPVRSLSDETVRALCDGALDCALFFSPRTAAIFAELAGRAGMADALRDVTAVSISTAADRALGELRFRERLVAAAPTQASLLAALDTCPAEDLAAAR